MKSSIEGVIDNRISDLYAEFASSEEPPGVFLRKIARAELNEREVILGFLEENKELDVEELISAIRSGFHR